MEWTSKENKVLHNDANAKLNYLFIFLLITCVTSTNDLVASMHGIQLRKRGCHKGWIWWECGPKIKYHYLKGLWLGFSGFLGFTIQ